jgi:hypothetical protein
VHQPREAGFPLCFNKLMHSKTDAIQTDALRLQIFYQFCGKKDGSGVVEKTYV